MSLQRQTLAAIAAELNRTNQHHGPETLIDLPLGPALYLTDTGVHPDPVQIPDRLPATSVVILRDYDHPEREVLAARLAEMCQRRRLYFFVGGDAALAHRVGAHGVHLPERLIDRLPRLRQTYQTFLFTASCHSARALLRAERLGADAVLLSPVFPTHSHAETFSRPERTLGACRFRTLCRRSNIPVYALGGLNVDTAPRLRQSTLAGLASIRGYEG